MFSLSHQMVIINTCLGLFHSTAIRTLAYDGPQCSRSLKLSALALRLRLNRPHSWSPLPHTPVSLHSLSFRFCLSRPACITSALPTSQSKTYVYRTAPNACRPCWLHYLQDVFNFWGQWNNGRKKKSVSAFQHRHNTEMGNHGHMAERHLCEQREARQSRLESWY